MMEGRSANRWARPQIARWLKIYSRNNDTPPRTSSPGSSRAGLPFDVMQLSAFIVWVLALVVCDVFLISVTLMLTMPLSIPVVATLLWVSGIVTLLGIHAYDAAELRGEVFTASAQMLDLLCACAVGGVIGVLVTRQLAAPLIIPGADAVRWFDVAFGVFAIGLRWMAGWLVAATADARRALDRLTLDRQESAVHRPDLTG